MDKCARCGYKKRPAFKSPPIWFGSDGKGALTYYVRDKGDFRRLSKTEARSMYGKRAKAALKLQLPNYYRELFG